jgi:hypothetical protein
MAYAWNCLLFLSTYFFLGTFAIPTPISIILIRYSHIKFYLGIIYAATTIGPSSILMDLAWEVILAKDVLNT